MWARDNRCYLFELRGAVTSFAPSGLCLVFFPHGLRRGLDSFGAARLGSASYSVQQTKNLL